MYARLAASSLAVALTFTACGGGATSVPSARTPAASVAGKFVVTIPDATAAAARTPKYISPSAVSIAIRVNGGAAQIGDISVSSPNCTGSAGGRVCTLPLDAPAGNDTFAIDQYAGPNATGALLGSGSATATVVAGQVFTIAAVLNGSVATIQLVLGTVPPAGTAGSTSLTVSALDAAGNTIIGPGNYASPITLAVTDPTQQTSLSTSTLTAPTSTPITVTYAGGLGVSATITASAAGATPSSVVFAPAAGTVYYVGNDGANTLTAYPLTANGNTTPTRTVAGNATTLNFITSMATDASGNVYVATNADGVTVFGPRPNGNVAPIRTLAGANTLITGPSDITLDAQGDLYIANCGGCSGFTEPEAVLEFAPGAGGNVAPIRDITGAATELSGTTAVALDGAGNLLVASSSATSQIFVFPVGTTGNVAPISAIVGANTGLNGPQCVTTDSVGRIYVCNLSNTITVYAAGARGNVAPLRTIGGGNTQLSYPNQIVFDATGNMYVANFNNNTVTVFAPGANGNQAPLYTLTGPATGLNAPAGIILSP
jgi:sugar lactone lactonase YvrE